MNAIAKTAIHEWFRSFMDANDGTLQPSVGFSSNRTNFVLSMIRFTPSNQAPPKAGDILLSEPFLDDPYFGRKVVLLCEHNEEGSFGFVLNNFGDIDVDEVMDDLPKLNTRISVGGPVKMATYTTCTRDKTSLTASRWWMACTWAVTLNKSKTCSKRADSSPMKFDSSSGTAGGPQRNFRKRFEVDRGLLPTPRNWTS